MTDSLDKLRDSIAHLRDHIRQFVHERDWEQFHSPKNLAVSVMVEAAELHAHEEVP